MREVELAIIGGGPSGICAAIEASKRGARSVLIDEGSKLGGQIYRRLSNGFSVTAPNKLGKIYAQGTKLLTELEQYGGNIEYIPNTVVWGVFPGKEIAFIRDGKSEQIKAQNLIIGEGAHDRPIPFPGWTLPGVFGAAAALRMVKNERVLPGERILVSGTGPLQLLLASELVKAGAKVVAMLEATSPKAYWKYLPQLLGRLDLLSDGLDYFSILRKAKVPILFNHAIVEVQGRQQVERAIYTKVDEDWRTLSVEARTVEVDAVCSGYGLIPSSRLSRLCECKHEWNRYFGGWIACRNEYMETSIPGIFVVGDGGGIEGGLVAAEEGRIAGIKVCQKLGYITEDEAITCCSSISRRLKCLRRFVSAVNHISAIRAGLFSQTKDEVVVCTCEEITAGEVRRAIASGATNLDEIKALTGAGMGSCQGRMCESTIIQMISSETKKPMEEVKVSSVRPPIRPIPLSCFE